MGCATECVRYLFFAFNFIFCVLGAAILGVGIYSRIQTDSWKDLLKSETFFTAANLFIASGVIVAAIGFFGCCGAIKKYQCMLMTYAVMVMLIFVLEIAAGIYAYTKRADVEDKLTKGLRDGIMKTYGKSDDLANKQTTKTINWFQQNVKCCGVNGPGDWKNSTWYKTSGKNNTLVPTSCCKVESAKCNVGIKTNSSQIFTTGCIEKGKAFAKDNLWLIGGVGIGIAVVEIFGVGFAFCLFKAFKDDAKGGAA